MSFTSWLFGDNDRGKAKQSEDSCYDDEVSSQPYAHSHNQQAYMDPMSHRFSIKGRVYPALLPVENKKVTGRVLSGITDPELDVLDTFEDVEYERRTVDVSLMDSSQKLTAHAYVWANSRDPNLYGDWNFEEWRQAHMNDFLKMTMGFMEELELPESKPRVETYQSFYQQSGDNPPSS